MDEVAEVRPVYKNIIEDFVVKEAKSQLARLKHSRQKLHLADVSAFALNRLQPLYTTTFYGWMHQRWLAIRDFSEDISDAVSHAIANLEHANPLHDVNFLGAYELDSKAYILVRLSHLLGKSDLQWQEIPTALEMAIELKRQRTELNVSIANHHLVDELKSYLNRSKPKIVDRKGATNLTQNHPQTIEQMEMESYLLKAKLGISNVMERMVETTAIHLMRNLPAEAKDQARFMEVVAFALNRLPPLYATTERGYQMLYQKAVGELFEEVTLFTQEAISQVKSSPNSDSAPLYLYRCERRIDQEILPKLQQILNRPDLTWQNLVQAVESAIDPSEMER